MLAYANIVEQVDLPGPGPRGLRIVTGNINLETSYVTGGTAGVAAAFGLSAILCFIVNFGGGFEIDYAASVDKLKVYGQPAALAQGAAQPEVPAGTNLSATQIRVTVLGI